MTTYPESKNTKPLSCYEESGIDLAILPSFEDIGIIIHSFFSAQSPFYVSVADIINECVERLCRRLQYNIIDYTKSEVCDFIRYLLHEGHSATDVHRGLVGCYGIDIMKG